MLQASNFSVYNLAMPAYACFTALGETEHANRYLLSLSGS